jgi:hemolysin activation/secretion protein
MTKKPLWIFIMLALDATWVHGQAVAPDAGALFQQVPRPEPLQRPSTLVPDTIPGAASAVVPSVKVRVTGFKLKGNGLLSQVQLAPTLAPFLNQTLDLSQLERAAQAVGQRYLADGWVVSAYLPEQDITEGEVVIQVDEARLGAVQFSAADGLRGSPLRAQRYFDALLSAGQPLNTGALDRAQMLSSELLGLEVQTRFKKGQESGSTDIVVGLGDKPLLAGDLLLDNAGARATGRGRVGAFLELRNPLGSGDIWNLGLTRTEGSHDAFMGVGVPIGADGWRVGGSLAQYQYRLISPQFKALNLTGSLDSQGLQASYPLLRQRDSQLTLLLRADRRTMDNHASGDHLSFARTRSATLAVQGRHNDVWLGEGGRTSVQLGMTSGRLSLDGSPNQASDALGARTEGRYGLMRGSLSRLQTLGPGWTLQLSHTAQWANKNLNSSEMFFIGGANSVRAFPVSEMGGARGSLSTFELAWQFDRANSLIGFYDHGRVQINANNSFSQAPALNRLSLEGAGVGLQHRSDSGLLFKLIWARRLKENPRPTPQGTDQDGSLLRNQVWVSAQYSF